MKFLGGSKKQAEQPKAQQEGGRTAPMWYVLRDIRMMEEKGASEKELMTPSIEEKAYSANMNQREGLSQMLAMIMSGKYAVKGDDGRYYATPHGIRWLDTMVFPQQRQQASVQVQASAPQPRAIDTPPPLPPARDMRPPPLPRPPAARQPQAAAPQTTRQPPAPRQYYPPAGYIQPPPGAPRLQQPGTANPYAGAQRPGGQSAPQGSQGLQDFLNDDKRRKPYQQF